MTALSGKRVGLNATCYNDRHSGARQRFLGLYGKVIEANPQIEFFVYNPADCRISDAFATAPNVVARATPIPSAGRLRKAVRGLTFWQRALRQDRLDLFEHFNVPLVKAPDCPTILTVHDIRDARSSRPSALRLAYRAIWRRALGGADHVITVSDTMRDEVLAFAPGTPVTTVYNGVDTRLFEPRPAAGTSGDGDYLLAIGHLEPRKNYPVLLRALAALVASGCDERLIIVGRDGGGRPEVEALIERHELGGRVSIRSDVDDAELRLLYARCRLVVFPSRYEGFGIPLIEAMAAHRPCVTSDIAVFREITQGHGAYSAVDDPDAIAAQIRRVSDDPAFAARLVAYGAVRARDFDFTRLARQVTDLYERLLS